MLRQFFNRSSWLVAGLGLASTGWAQTPAPTTTGSSSELSEIEYKLEEIVVTAEKREETVQKTPISLTVLAGDELTKEKKTGLSEILEGVPGVQLQENIGGYVVNIRGVSNNAGGPVDNPTSIYTDGVYSSQLPIENRLAYFDLKRVEVQRGPQGTLWGGNALGGNVSIISNDPDPKKYEVSGTVTAGNYDLRSGQMVANVPITDKFAIRMVGVAENRRGYLGNGQDDSVYSGGRLKMLYLPTDDLKLGFTAIYVDVGGEGVGSLQESYPTDVHSLPDPWANTSPTTIDDAQVTPSSHAHMASYRGNLEWSTSIGTLTFLPAYTKINQLTTAAPNVQPHIQHQRTNIELRLNSPTESSIKWAVGAYYQHFNTPLDVRVALNVPAFLGGPYYIRTGQKSLKDTQSAAFGQITVPVTDAFRLTAGIRQTHVKIDEVDFFHPVLPPPPIGAGDLGEHDYTGTDSFNATTWKAGFEFDVATDSMLYGSISTGFRAGGLVAGGNNNVPPNPDSTPLPTFDPEKMTAYAFGSKNQFLNQTLQLNGEVFYYDFTNYQVQNNINAGGVTQSVTANAQGVKEYGGELESIFLITAADKINAAVAYLHGRFGTQSGATANPTTSNYIRDNSELDHAPEWTVQLGYGHTWTLGAGGSLEASADVNYVTDQKAYYGENCHAAGVPCISPAHHLSNAKVSYNGPDDVLGVTAYIRNIENYAVLNSATPAAGSTPFSQNVGAPRTFGVSLSFKFGVDK